ncbi:hypothetical protein [Virgibacillus sp. DJP39]|uniref:hypothetical protein n=1 Tax=Virgibacillus sp. DJP39 TaxID=3409790 RepID=UPI003BB5135D
MKNLRNVLVLLLLAVIVAGCNPDSNSESEESANSTNSTNSSTKEEPLQNLMEKYPKVESTWQGLPEEFRKKVIMPQVSTFPFKVDDIQVLTVAAGVLPPGVKTNFDVMYKAKNSFPRIHVTTFDVDGQEPSFGAYKDKVELNKGIVGYYSEKAEETEISWLSEDNSVQYNIRYKDGVDGKDSITKEKLTEIANSMIKQTK